MSKRALQAVADLERRTLAVDGGRLKLEWGALTSRTGDRVEDLLWWEGDRVLGFLGLYAFGSPTVELAGMVDPAVRRRGIGTALLDAALPLFADRGFRTALLVTPRGSAAGSAFALNRGATLEHSEHALLLSGPPADGPTDPRTMLRTAAPADAPEVARLLAAAFGGAASDQVVSIGDPGETILLIEHAGFLVGTVRLTREGEAAGVYAFAIDPAWQGRGIGRDVLRRVCTRLRAESARQIRLEVFVDNERALGLYTSVGFARVTTEDYYSLPASSWMATRASGG